MQWQDTVENSRKRDELINQTGEEFGQKKDELDQRKNDLEQNKQRLDREKENNKSTEADILA